MKIFSRDFTLKEKILLLILCILLLGLAYYQFVDQPVRSAIQTANAEREIMETELTAVQAKLMKLEQMKNELDALPSNVSIMGSYNNSKAEMAMLNDILEATDQYSISFTDVTREGDQICRNFTLQFTTENYSTMEKVLTELVNGKYRCLLSDVHCASKSGDVRQGQVSVSATATFYETMVGGTPDAALPEDSAAAQNTENIE